MPIQSLNPATGKIVATFPEISDQEVFEKITTAEECFHTWKNIPLEERKIPMLKLADLLEEQSEEIAECMAIEMGKPITQGIGEAKKCAWVCRYYAEKTEEFLTPEIVETDNSESFVRLDPIGIILAVMPWNYPFWQVIRFIAPAAMAGNVGILKHASNVPQCALKIEELFNQAGFPKGVFQTLLVGSGKVKSIIADERIKAVTLTGSEYAGSQVAMQSGKHIKKTVLELGGSDPFIVLEDADLDAAAKNAALGRFQNTGQSCIASKRFIVMESIIDEFTEKFKQEVEKLKMGDPLNPETTIGPISGKSAFEDAQKQVQQSLEKGAILVTGGKTEGDVGYFFQPTILKNVKKGMAVYDEETFCPIAAVISVSSVEEAIKVANDTVFGLGGSIHTKDIELAKNIAIQLNTGAVFINQITKSDPRLPFGGIGKSGYGRELGKWGQREFLNIKTVAVK